ncbi:MAG: hypothetical protein K2X38_17645 [Gemmataceae bacterium]|nr:hypothetical protein [Gemmataceae bacterium]
MQHRVCKAWAIAAALILLAGCGSGHLAVSGRVTYKGKPVENGTIALEPEDRKGPTREQPIVQGEYRFAGANTVPAGPKLVRIQAFGPTGKKTSAAPGSSQMVDVIGPLLPEEYNAKSKLRINLEASNASKLDFNLPQ